MTGELRLVHDLLARFGAGTADEVWLGDDAAVVKPPTARLLLAIDPVVAGVHFDERVPAGDVGWNALARNLSDLAAMGGRPLHALVSLVIPSPSTWPIDEVVAGLAEAADAFGCRIVGGDTAGGPALIVTVAVTGTVDGPAVLRSGARPGDIVFVTGPLGATSGRIQPRLGAGEAARRAGATAMIDISDGLALDLRRLAEASSVGIELDGPLPVIAGRRWGDGDCYELAFTAPDVSAVDAGFDAMSLPRPIPIGRCVVDPTRLRLDGAPLPAGGWIHDI